MTKILECPFNLFSWSLALFLLTLLVQATVSATFLGFGVSPAPAIALFAWASVSAGVAYGLQARYKAALSHLLLVQAFACFLLTCTVVAATLRADDMISVSRLLTLAGFIVATFSCGVLGTAASRVVRERLAA